MDELLQQLAKDSWGRLVVQYLATGGLKSSMVFLLVGARLSGVLLVAPCFGTMIVPVWMRVGLVVMLSMVLTPALAGMPLDNLATTQASYASSGNVEMSLMELGRLLLSELSLGTLLGVGVISVLSGLRFAGDWLFQHSGLGVGLLLNPEGAQDARGGGSLIQMMGIGIFLTLKPVGGLFLVVQALLQSFQSLPVGSADWMQSVRPLVGELLQQSLILGLRIAIPLIAVMTLIDVALAFVGRDTPMMLTPYSLVIRTSASMIILALTITVLPEVILTATATMFQSLRGVR